MRLCGKVDKMRIDKGETINVRGIADFRNAESFFPKPESLTEDAMATSTKFPASYSKQWLPIRSNLGFANDDAVTSKTYRIHVANGAGTIHNVRVQLPVAITNGGDLAIDVKKNGTTILSSTVDFTSGDSNNDIKAGTLSVTSYSEDDYFDVEVTATSSPDGTGILVQVDFEELAA